MIEPDNKLKKVTVGITWGPDGGAVAVDGKLIGAHQPPSPPKRTLHARECALDPSRLSGPKLKVKRAKKHIAELEALIHAFYKTNPYELYREQDAKTGEYVHRMRVHSTIPAELSAVTGDAVHNLRAALDQLVCQLVLANRRQIQRGTGFPISQSAKHFASNSVGKIKGVSARADRLIRRLKPYKSGNTPLWILHELDVLDKHQGIIPVAAANVSVKMNWSFTPISTHDGSLYIGNAPPGARHVQTGPGIPIGSNVVYPVEDNSEVYRSAPHPLNEEIQCTISIAFGQTQITKGEPILETLQQLVIFLERVIAICETRIV